MILLANDEAASGVAKTAELLKQSQPALHAIEAERGRKYFDEDRFHEVGLDLRWNSDGKSTGKPSR